MYDKAVNTSLPALKFVVFSNDDIIFVNVDPDNGTFFSDDMGLNLIYLNNINLDDDSFDGYDPEKGC